MEIFLFLFPVGPLSPGCWNCHLMPSGHDVTVVTVDSENLFQ
jgi:hypothetical protein